MKRYGNIFAGVCDIENIKLAIRNASKGKKHRRTVARVVQNADKYSERVRDMLVNQTYTPSPYREFTIKDGATKKERVINCPAFFPDQIIHWALIQRLQPYLMKTAYALTCGSVPGKGTHYGARHLRRWLDHDRKNTKYCLKLDIKKFYPSIDREKLKAAFAAKFKDKGVLWLIDTIIDSHASGVPIGNYTSQWFANFFLRGLDNFIKQDLHVVYYIRYMDDMVLLGRNKKELHRARREIEAYLLALGLRLKENWQVFRVDKRDIDFLGFRFYRHKTTLRRRNALRMRRRVRKVYKKQKITYKDATAIFSYLGWLKHSDSHMFFERYIQPFINIKKFKEAIRRENRKQLTAGGTV